MRRYSPAEAIGPAWEQTTAIMWRSRTWLTGLKIAFIALLAEAGGASFNFNFPGRHAPAQEHAFNAVNAAMLSVALFVGILFFIFGVILFYIGSRMQFVHFSVIAFRDTHIKPLWHRYAGVTWRWIGFKLLLILGFLVPLLPFVYTFSHRLKPAVPGEMPHFGEIFAFFGVILLITIPFVMFYTAARDFVLPSIALEGTTIRFALKRFLLWLQAEPGGIILFLVMRLVLGIVIGIAAYLTLVLALLVSAIPFGILGAMVWIPLKHGSMGLLGGLFAGILLIIYLVWAVILGISVFGTVCTFYIAWGTYYLGGRYPLLGDMLEPPYTLESFTPPPSFPTRDDTSGPDFPLNPQPAS